MPPAKKPRFDPPHIIRHRTAIAHQLRDPLYGGETPWDGDTRDERERRKMAWALLYKWYAGSGRFTYEEMQAEAASYARKFGVATARGTASDEILRNRFVGWLNERVKELGYIGRVTRQPGHVKAGVGIRSVQIAIEATHDAAERAAK